MVDLKAKFFKAIYGQMIDVKFIDLTDKEIIELSLGAVTRFKEGIALEIKE